MAGINQLVRKLERLGSAEVKDRIAANVRDTVHAEAIQGFNEKRDPYGSPWEPRKKPPDWAVKAFGLMQDNHPLLDKTGKGISTLTARALAGGRVVMKIISYFKFHQTGTYKMVARKIFPDEERGLGLWAEPVYRSAVKAVRDLMRD